MFLRYNELRALIGDAAAFDARALIARAQGGARAVLRVPAASMGRNGDAEPARLPVPRQLGLPREVPPPGRGGRGPVQGHRRLPGRGRGRRPSRAARGPVRHRSCRRHPRLPHDQSGLGRALHQDRWSRHQRRRPDRASGSAEPRVRHPGSRRNPGRDRAHSSTATGSASTAQPAQSTSSSGRPSSATT